MPVGTYSKLVIELCFLLLTYRLLLLILISLLATPAFISFLLSFRRILSVRKSSLDSMDLIEMPGWFAN